MLRKFLIIFSAGLFIIGLNTFEAQAQTSIIDEIRRLQPAIVSVKSMNTDIYKEKPQLIGIDQKTGRLIISNPLFRALYNRFGAGVLIHPDGIIVTNAHTVHRANHITVTLNDQTEIPASVVFFMNDIDICLIRISLPYPIPPVELADSDQIHLGDEIMTVGNSGFLKQTLSGGKISGLGVDRNGPEKNGHKVNLIQTSINLYKGDSGGPLFDRRGRLVGMMTAKENDADHSSFAVPANYINDYLQQYLSRLKP